MKSDAENRRSTVSSFQCVLEVPHLDLLIQMLLFMEGFSSPSLAKAMSFPPGMVVPPHPAALWQQMTFPWTQLPRDMSSALWLSPEMDFSSERDFWKETQRWHRPGDAGVRSPALSPARSASLLPLATRVSEQAWFLIYPLFLSKHPNSQRSGSIFAQGLSQVKAWTQEAN